MIIYSEDDVYLNVPKQMLDFIEDTKKILKFRKDEPFAHNDVLFQNIMVHQLTFAKQTVINHFNTFVNLITQNRNFDAVMLLKMLNQTIIESQAKTSKEIPVLFPKNLILGRNNTS